MNNDRTTTEQQVNTQQECKEGLEGEEPIPPTPKGGENKPRPRFVKPTLSDVTAYVAKISAGIDPQGFMDFYESKGWRVGNQGMKDWQAAVRTWKRTQAEKNGNTNGQKSTLINTWHSDNPDTAGKDF